MNPKHKFKKPIEMPFKIPNPITVCGSKGLCSKKFSNRATCNEQNVTRRCQLVRVVAKLNPKVVRRALLQITMETDEMTERLRAPTVPSCLPVCSVMAENGKGRGGLESKE